MTQSSLRVLIVDDSLTVRRFLASLIAEAPDMTVVGEARDGEEAIRLAARLRPDIISMDIQMPRLDGLAATQRLMQENPVPIVIVSSRLTRRHDEEVDLAFLALQAGALAVLETPPNHRHADFPAQRDHFLSTLRAMAGVSVVRRWGKTGPLPTRLVTPPSALALEEPPQVIAIGASAGGPVALYKILGALPADFSVPIAVVQHMAEGFVEGMVRWLNGGTPLHVTQAQHGQIVRGGQVVVAGSGAHLTLRRVGNEVRVALTADRGDNPYLPSVDVLFASVAENFGAQAMGVLLTGMGADGAQGLLAMRELGARTIVQDQRSCLVYGMPGAAVSLGAAEQVVPLEQIAATILDMSKIASNG